MIALVITPLLVIPLVVYNLMALFGAPAGWMFKALFTITMFSGDQWDVSSGDVFLALSLMLLFIEVTKSTRTDAIAIINHGLSMLIAVVGIIQFVAVPGFANSVFFIFVLMMLFDVVAGFTVTIVAAKRDFGSSGGIAGTN